MYTGGCTPIGNVYITICLKLIIKGHTVFDNMRHVQCGPCPIIKDKEKQIVPYQFTF